MAKHDLAVLEGRWDKRRNHSIFPVFDTLLEVEEGSRDAYFRFQFPNASGLRHIIEHVAATPHTRVLYIGAHGDAESLEGSLGPDRGRVTREELRAAISVCWKERDQYFDGLYFGSCTFGSPRNARMFLTEADGPETGLQWVAGYSRQIDWTESTLFDALMLRRLLNLDPSRTISRPKLVAKYVVDHCLGLANRLGFQIYLRDDAAEGGVRALLEF